MATKTKVIPADINASQYSSEDTIKLWLGNVRGVKGVPNKLLSRRPNDYFYKDNELFFVGGGKVLFPTAKVVTHNRQRYILVASRGKTYNVMTQNGYKKNVSQLLHLIKGGMQCIEMPGNELKLSLANARDWYACRIYEHSTLLLASRIFKLSWASISKPPPAPKIEPVPKEYTKQREGSAKHDVLGVLAWYTPEAKAARAKEKALQKFINDARGRTYRCTAMFERSYFDTKHVVDSFKDIVPVSQEEVFTYLGHVHVDGMMYKRLQHRTLTGADDVQRYTRHGDWPDVGVWTAKVENIKACQHGWHLSPKSYLNSWSDWGDHLYVAEGRGDSDARPDKTAYAEARLVKYVGDIGRATLGAIIKARPVDPVREAQREAAQYVCDLARGDYLMALAGYADCIPNAYDLELHYVVRLMDQSIPLNK